jgi:hypothetical protein
MVVNRLISANTTEKYFHVGQLFGRTAATLERWARLLHHGLGELDSVSQFRVDYRDGKCLWAVRDEHGLTEEYHDNVKALLGEKLVQECWHAATALSNEASRVVSGGGYYDDPLDPTGPAYLLQDALSLAEARATIRFALGNLLGALREVDDAAQERDRRSLTPRPHLLNAGASANQIAGLIRMVEQTFSDRGDKSLQPEYVVNCTANAIEALTKRLWPKEFGQKGLRKILLDHAAVGTQTERRFAQVGLTLYTVYRNPVAHELGTFKCTWDEARFFHSGIRTLHSLSEEVEKSRSNGKA